MQLETRKEAMQKEIHFEFSLAKIKLLYFHTNMSIKKPMAILAYKK